MIWARRVDTSNYFFRFTDAELPEPPAPTVWFNGLSGGMMFFWWQRRRDE